MQYKKFGKLGYDVSVLGLGAMRLPKEVRAAVEVVRRAIDLGVNYVDTAPYYLDGESEVLVGEALKNGYRDKVLLVTKNPIEDVSGENYRKRFEKSLQKLQTDYVDFYHMWGINLKTFKEKIDVPKGPLEEAYKLKKEGLIKHISFSFHDKPENLLTLLETGVFDSVLVQYNLLDQSHAKGIERAYQKGMGVVVMGPVAGGRLGAPSKHITDMIPGGVKSSAEAALKFVLANPFVHIALSGMETVAMVEENVAVASRPLTLTEEEIEQINQIVEEKRRLAELYCTGCNYCLPCPYEVNIPENFKYMNYHRVYNLTDVAKKEYAKLGTEGNFIKGKKAEDCQECGACEPKCPQGIPIIEQLRETAKHLG